MDSYRPRLVTAVAVCALVGGVVLLATTLALSQGPTNPKMEAAARNTPPPAPASPKRWSAHSVAEVEANLASDGNYAAAIARLSSGPEPDPRAVGRIPTLGTPLFVRGLAVGNPDEYLVPVNIGVETIAIIKIGVDAKGLGQIDAVRGWSNAPTFPATTQASAMVIASTAADPAVKAELVWAQIRAVADDLQPFWRLTRASGAVYFLFEDGRLTAAGDMGF